MTELHAANKAETKSTTAKKKHFSNVVHLSSSTLNMLNALREASEQTPQVLKRGGK